MTYHPYSQLSLRWQTRGVKKVGYSFHGKQNPTDNYFGCTLMSLFLLQMIRFYSEAKLNPQARRKNISSISLLLLLQNDVIKRKKIIGVKSNIPSYRCST